MGRYILTSGKIYFDTLILGNYYFYAKGPPVCGGKSVYFFPGGEGGGLGGVR